MEEKLLCPICCNNEKDIVINSCKHRFCQTCIDKLKNKDNLCPTCRKEIKDTYKVF